MCHGAPHWREVWKGKYPFITGLYAIGNQLLILDSPMPSIADGGDVYSWTVDSGKPVHRLRVDEQGISVMRAYGRRLYLAGCDATEDWSYGNFYESVDGGLTWVKHRTIPNAMHVFDICRWRNALVVGTSTTDPPGGTVCFSDDDGRTWRPEIVAPAPAGGWGRVILLMPTPFGLYAHYTTSSNVTGWKVRTSKGWREADLHDLPNNLWMPAWQQDGKIGLMASRWKAFGKGMVAFGMKPFALVTEAADIRVVVWPATGGLGGSSAACQDMATGDGDTLYAVNLRGLLKGSLAGLWRGKPAFELVLDYPPGQLGLSVATMRDTVFVGTWAVDGGRILALEP